MQNSEPNPVTPLRKDEIVSRAWAEALAMACGDADHAHRPQGELVAAALKAHHTLSRGLGHSGPVAAVGSDGGVRWLAAFVAEYAAHQNQRDDRRHGEAA
ncbi:hypothetical protein [Streptomyces sp. WM6378]|uniref:hypothetical protein n=1 Tax=Streptomyces sp. WM6378 TaxID=1415557 RepID=UPI0006B002D7|nr:hypothetical protein [Streptomyces sp. WM6378]KOU40404.1 hypothetical protein ADK54_22545 [Streptomyces sp. WM6378]